MLSLSPCTRIIIASIVIIIFSAKARAQNTPSGKDSVPAATPATVQAAYSTQIVNYIRTYEPSSPVTTPGAVAGTDGGNSSRQSTVYLDGLGRTLQTVIKGESGLNQRDIVTPTIYDAYNREQFKYLPYAQQNGNVNDGKFKIDPFHSQELFYQNNVLNPGIGNDKIFYTEVEYEPSPLNRVSKTYNPGNSWAKTGGNRPIEQQYLLNAVADSVRIWTMPVIGYVPISTAIYPAGKLHKDVIIDENGNKTILFTNTNKQLLLKKVQISSATGIGHLGWLCTYYVYDDFDKLRFVIPPLATEKITSNWNAATVSYGLCYSYRYDEEGRLIMKKIPGSDSSEFVYDNRDRPVFSRDGNLKVKNQWLVNFYDGQNRIILKALYNANATVTRASLQISMDGVTGGSKDLSYNFPGVTDLVVVTHDGRALYEAKESITFNSGFDTGTDAELVTLINTGAINGTTTINADNPLPQISSADLTPLIYTYYDRYDFAGVMAPLATDFNKPITTPEQNPVLITGTSKMTRGLVTGAKIRIVDTDQWITSTNYYNDQGDLIQALQDNASGGQDVLTTVFNFNGLPLSNYFRHKNPRSVTAETTVLQMFTYDAASRLLTLKERLNDSTANDKMIAIQDYDELGQVKIKRLGVTNTGQLERIIYDYNVRGWLKTIGKDYLNGTDDAAHFGQEYNYDNGFTENQFNKNIAGIRWKGYNDKTVRAYGFQYDKSSRITAAHFSQQNKSGAAWSKDVMDFSVDWLTYDANGNILSMAQNGLVGTKSMAIDRLAYSYEVNGNRLLAVKDSSPVTNSLGDFKNSISDVTDYVYDSSGNAIKDLNRKITDIVYNYLGLPKLITFANQSTILYQYNATGQKIRKIVTDRSGSQTKLTTTDYIGQIVYKNDSLQFVTNPEGRARAVYRTGSPVSYIYDFFVKDLLGNTRIVLTDESNSAIYKATMETASASKEAALFSNLDNTRISKPIGYPDEGKTSKNEAVAKLNGLDGKKVGPSIVLRVMAGDTIQIGAKAFYKSAGPQKKEKEDGTVINMLSDLVAAFAGNNQSGGGHGTSTLDPQTPFTTNFYNNDYQRLKDKDPDQQKGDKPKAYLNYVLFDDQFKMVEDNSGVMQVKEIPDQLQILSQDKMVAKKSGFLYVYTSNESPQDVFFDDVTVMDAPGPILEETHYYPLGLTMEGISYNALRGTDYDPNKIKFTGKEIQKNEFADGSGLEEYDFGARFYDPQIGRWHAPDPLSESSRRWTPYNYAYNNPMRFVDPDGMLPETVESVSGHFSGGENNGGSINFSTFEDYLTGTINMVSGGEPDQDKKGKKNDKGKTAGKTKAAFIPLLPLALEEAAAYWYGAGMAGGLFHFPTADEWEASRKDFGTTLYGRFLTDYARKTDGLTSVVLSLAWHTTAADKMKKELDKLYTKALNTPGVVYALVAKSDGIYNVYGWGSGEVPVDKVGLKSGEVWKYGETTDPDFRYTPKYLREENVTFVPLFTGNQVQIKAMEKFLIYGYFFQHGSTPAGNRGFR